MSALLSFMKKEWMEQVRSGRFLILGIIFVLFGIMNPAVAKMTPGLLESMADSLEGTGIIITEVEVTAMESWVQFFKNTPMMLIAFLLLQSSIFTKEYQSGTLMLALTKGLERYKVLMAKSSILVLLWTCGYWTCFGITYLYNAYFWDNSIAKNLMFSAVCWWLFGMLTCALLVFFSMLASSNTGALAGTGVVVVAAYVLTVFPKSKKYSPALLMDGNALIYGIEDTEQYMAAVGITLLIMLFCFMASIPILNKKQIF